MEEDLEQKLSESNVAQIEETKIKVKERIRTIEGRTKSIENVQETINKGVFSYKEQSARQEISQNKVKERIRKIEGRKKSIESEQETINKGVFSYKEQSTRQEISQNKVQERIRTIEGRTKSIENEQETINKGVFSYKEQSARQEISQNKEDLEQKLSESNVAQIEETKIKVKERIRTIEGRTKSIENEQETINKGVFSYKEQSARQEISQNKEYLEPKLSESNVAQIEETKIKRGSMYLGLEYPDPYTHNSTQREDDVDVSFDIRDDVIITTSDSMDEEMEEEEVWNKEVENRMTILRERKPTYNPYIIARKFFERWSGFIFFLLLLPLTVFVSMLLAGNNIALLRGRGNRHLNGLQPTSNMERPISMLIASSKKFVDIPPSHSTCGSLIDRTNTFTTSRLELEESGRMLASYRSDAKLHYRQFPWDRASNGTEMLTTDNAELRESWRMLASYRSDAKLHYRQFPRDRASNGTEMLTTDNAELRESWRMLASYRSDAKLHYRQFPRDRASNGTEMLTTDIAELRESWETLASSMSYTEPPNRQFPRGSASNGTYKLTTDIAELEEYLRPISIPIASSMKFVDIPHRQFPRGSASNGTYELTTDIAELEEYLGTLASYRSDAKLHYRQFPRGSASNGTYELTTDIAELEESGINSSSSTSTSHFDNLFVANEEQLKPDLKFALTVTLKGAHMHIPDTGVELDVPTGAVRHKQLIEMTIIPFDKQYAPIADFSSNSSVVVELLPNKAIFSLPVHLKLPHCLQLKKNYKEIKNPVTVFVSHHEAGPPVWEEDSSAVCTLEGDHCIILLKQFCWVKYEINDKIVVAKRLKVFTAGKGLHPNDIIAEMEVGYYMDLPGRAENMSAIRGMDVYQTKPFVFVKEGKVPLHLVLSKIVPKEWTYITPDDNPKTISYKSVADDKDTSCPFALEKSLSSERKPYCIFKIAQGNESVELSMRF